MKSSEKNVGLKYTLDDILSAATLTKSANQREHTNEYMKTYNVIHRGDIVFEGHTSKEFSYGRFVLNDGQDGIVSHVFDVYTPNQSQQSSQKFVKYYLHNEKILYPILLRSTSNARMLNSLNSKELYKQKILFPQYNEQKKIGELLTKIEKNIASNQRNLNKPLWTHPP
jgi:type I restriction enzyme S subunit